MVHILHSEYRTLEYIIWHCLNFKDSDLSKKIAKEEDLIVMKSSLKSRNWTSSLILPNKNNVFIKQSPTFEKTVENEANLYIFLKENRINIKNVSEYLYFDNFYKLLFFKEENSDSLYSILLKLFVGDKNDEIKVLLENLGKTIKSIHTTIILKTVIDSKKFEYGFPNEVLKLKEPKKELSISNIDTEKLKSEDITKLSSYFNNISKQIIEEVNKKWVNNSLIHFDFRPQNVLINQKNEAFIIDWEMTGIGDNYWDLAFFCNEIPKVFESQFYITEKESEYISDFKEFIDSFLQGYFGKNDRNKTEKIKWFMKGIHLDKYGKTDNDNQRLNKIFDSLL